MLPIKAQQDMRRQNIRTKLMNSFSVYTYLAKKNNNWPHNIA